MKDERFTNKQTGSITREDKHGAFEWLRALATDENYPHNWEAAVAFQEWEKLARSSTSNLAEGMTRAAAIVDEMQVAWHDSDEEHSGHYMDAAARIADVLRERAKLPLSARAKLHVAYVSPDYAKVLNKRGERALELLKMAHGNCDLHVNYAAVIGMWSGDAAVDDKDFADVVGEFLNDSDSRVRK